jgi:lysophospholipase L1-like esterase
MARVAMVGDSHSVVFFPMLVPQIEAAGHQVVLRESNNGWSEAKYISDGLPARLKAAKPDWVVFELGANNWKMDPATYAADVKVLYQAAKDAGASRVIWMSPPKAVRADIEEKHEKTSEMQKALFPSLGIEWIDTRPFMNTGHSGDGVHFGSAQYKVWAANTIQPILSPPLMKAAMPWFLAASILVLAGAVALRFRRAH